MRIRHLTAMRHLPAPCATGGWDASVGVAARTALDWVRACLARWRQRHALGQLDERLLRDIGRDRLAAAHEVAKPFWRR
jgi:uncharacterized protein YjiS (DUF1127 family)